MLLKYSLTILLFMIAGCGSESQQSTPLSPNTAPSITIVQSEDYFEGESVRVNFNVSDNDGDPVTLSLGGSDANLFVIDNNESAIFAITAFDYESPSDADGNNSYSFDLIANDGKVSSKLTVILSINNIIENDELNTRRQISLGDKLTYNATYKGLESYPTSMSGPGSMSIEYLPFDSNELLNTDVEGEAFLQKITFSYNDTTHELNEVVIQKSDFSLHTLAILQSDSQTYCTNYQESCLGFMLEPPLYYSGEYVSTNFTHNLMTDVDIVRDIYSTSGVYSLEVGPLMIFEDDNGIKYETFEVNTSRVFDEPPQPGHIKSIVSNLYVHPGIGLLGGEMRLITHLDVGSRSADIQFKLTSKNF